MTASDDGRDRPSRPFPSRSVISPVLRPAVPEDRRRRVVPVFDERRSPVLVELDLAADVSTASTRDRFLELHERVVGSSRAGEPRPVADCYVSCVLGPREIEELVAADRSASHARTIFRVWPDYRVEPHLDRSATTIKSDAAARCYAADGAGVTWAILDSGIDEHHPHFASGTLGAPAAALHHDFTSLVLPDGSTPAPGGPRPGPLHDADGHGTHVAGIIAGALPADTVPLIGTAAPSRDGLPGAWVGRELPPGRGLAGIAPRARLVSLKVLADQDGDLVTSSSAVIAALYHVRESVNSGGRMLLVHGVNLSLGCRWDPADYAAGQSPLCREVDLLVGTGVVVVTTAGNDGYAGARSASSDARGVLASISDPGNAVEAITVGSTHRTSPHRFGVTYTSSKGPTLDGRLKPDLLAPGERITSCASGRLAEQLAGLASGASGTGAPGASGASPAAYIEDSGTSMAAAHVSGAVAAFLSVRPEFIGRPREVKALFTANATSLGRDRFLEGHGLVDLMQVLSAT